MSDESPKDTTKLTKKQRRKAAQRRQLLTFLGIVVLVVVVAGVVLGVQRYRSSQDGTAPQDLRVTVVTADGSSSEIAPYAIWADGESRDSDATPSPVALPADGEITLKLPSDVYDHDWKLLKIYEDYGANTENSYAANEMKELTVAGSSERTDDDGKHPRLIGLEIQSVLIDSSGDEEEPVVAVWSLTPDDVKRDATGR